MRFLLPLTLLLCSCSFGLDRTEFLEGFRDKVLEEFEECNPVIDVTMVPLGEQLAFLEDCEFDKKLAKECLAKDFECDVSDISPMLNRPRAHESCDSVFICAD